MIQALKLAFIFKIMQDLGNYFYTLGLNKNRSNQVKA